MPRTPPEKQEEPTLDIGQLFRDIGRARTIEVLQRALGDWREGRAANEINYHVHRRIKSSMLRAIEEELERQGLAIKELEHLLIAAEAYVEPGEPSEP